MTPLRWMHAVLIALLFALPARADELRRGVFVIEYPPGRAPLAAHAADVLEAAVQEHAPRLKTGVAPIRFALCSTIFDFSRYAGPYPGRSVSGVAVSEEGFVAVKTPDILEGPAGFEGVLRHELLHVLLARNVKLENLPRWLNEGVCMVYSHEYRWESELQVAEMYLRGDVIPYFELTVILDYNRGERAFGEAYAQSYSMTRFLIARLGDDRFWAMILSLNRQTFGDALREYLQLSPGPFYDAWKASLWKFAVLFSIMSGFGVFQVAALLTFWGWWRKRRQRDAKFEEWDEEEAWGDDADVPGDAPEEAPEPLDLFHDEDDDPEFYQPWEWDEENEEDEPERPSYGPRRGRRRRGKRR